MTKIKTTHVGSLPRPQELIAKTLRKEKITSDDMKQSLKKIVEKQLSLEIDYINNGELPRENYISSTVNRIAGFNSTGIAPLPQDLEELPDFSRRFNGRNGLITLNPKAPVTLPACSDELTYTGEESVLQELNMMTEVFNQLGPSFPQVKPQLFFTAPSPGTIALFMENKWYPDYEHYLEKISLVLKQEYECINNHGFYLQIDCPDLAMGRHTGFKHLNDDEFVQLIQTNIRYLNQALESIDPNFCRIHVCWGNYMGPHNRDIDLKKIFHQILEITAKYISVEASNHRHGHEWSVFKEFGLPDDKVVMPGVIDTASNVVEHPELVAQRLLNYINILGAERVIASTDCGFASTASATSVSGEIAWLKLAALVEGATIAGKRL